MIRSYILFTIFATLSLFLSSDLFAQQVEEPVKEATIAPEKQQEIVITKKKIVFDGKDFYDLPWQNSVMFSDKELKDIYNLMNKRFYRRKPAANTSQQDPSNIEGSLTGQIKGELEGVINQVTGQEASPPPGTIPKVAPAFHLNSILFYGPNNWTLWINHRRIRRNTKLERLEITKVTKNYMEMVWKPINLNISSPGWENILSKITTDSELKEVDAGEIVGGIQGSNKRVKSVEEIASNINEILTDLEIEETSEYETITVFEEINPSEKNNKNKELELELPNLYRQEVANLDINKLSSMLSKEREDIAKREEAENVINLARAAEKLGTDEDSEFQAYNAYQDKDIPFLWEYKSDNGSILVDTINGVVKFRIFINQTFVSRNMEIREGFVASTSLAGETRVVGRPTELETGDLESTIFNSEEKPQNNPEPETSDEELEDAIINPFNS